MSNNNSHYEVHGRQANSWIVQGVFDDKQSAIESAGNLFKELSLKAVKVLEVSYGSDEPVFHDKEIFYKGERAKTSDAPDVDLIGPICRNTADLYMPEARRSISTLLHKPLAGWKLTPLEILYHAENLQKLNDTGQILQGAVQRVAVSQIQKTGQKVNERVLDLYALTNELLQDLKTRRHEGEFISLDGEDLPDLLKKSKETENPTLVFMIAFAHFFKEIPSLDLKFEKILEFLTLNDDPEIIEFLDQYLADFLFSSENIKKLQGDSDSLGDGLLGLIDLIRAVAKPKHDSHVALPRISELIGKNLLPETRKSLAVKVKTTLKGNASFVKGDPLKSILFHRRILLRLKVENGTHVGGQESVEALTDRCARMTGSTSVAEFLAGLEHPLDRVERLIEIANGVVGSSNMRTIANYILPILESQYNTNLVLENSDNDLALMARLSHLQEKVRTSEIQDFFQERITVQLDQIGLDVFVKKKVKNQLVGSSVDKLQLGFTLLRLVADGAVPSPNVLTAVRTFAKQIIMSADFMGELQKKAITSGADADLLKEFSALLESTRIDK